MNGSEEYDGRADDGPLATPLGDRTDACWCGVLTGGVLVPPPFIEESALLCLLRVELTQKDEQLGLAVLRLLGGPGLTART